VSCKDTEAESALAPAYTNRLDLDPIPKYRIPEHSAAPEAAYQSIHDELLLDGSSRLNLATFVTTRMEPEADRLMAEAFDKNMIDKDEYPQTAEIERRCVTWSRTCSTPGGRRRGRRIDDRVQRGRHARRDGTEVAVAGPPRAAGAPADRPNLIPG
jgi:hypothetical protein